MTSGSGPPRPWRDLLVEVTAVLGSAQEATWMAVEASGYDRTQLLARLDEAVPARAGAHLSAMVARRCAGEPLQYVLGRWPFRQLELFVDRRVLIPRPETEEVVEWALEEVGRAPGPDRRLRVADLGTGSGAIALSLAVELRAEVWATDVSADALDVARANLAGIGMWAAPLVRLVQGSWWDALPGELQGGFDLVVANPPYVGAGEQLPAVVADWEPELALRAGPDGLDALRRLIPGAASWLVAGGVLVVEHAPHQAGAAAALARAAGAVRTAVRTDAQGRHRALVAHW